MLDTRLFLAKSTWRSCNLQSEIYNLQFSRGVLAQLVERLNGIEEVTGSNPVGSTFALLRTAAVVAQLCEFVLITWPSNGNKRVTFPMHRTA